MELDNVELLNVEIPQNLKKNTSVLETVTNVTTKKGNKMSRDKQIEEMAKDLGIAFQLARTTRFGAVAEVLVNAGYRKAEDVAMEIFEELEKYIANLEYRANTPRKTVNVEELKAQVNWILHEVVPATIAVLKKKYESEGEG